MLLEQRVNESEPSFKIGALTAVEQRASLTIGRLFPDSEIGFAEDESTAMQRGWKILRSHDTEHVLFKQIVTVAFDKYLHTRTPDDMPGTLWPQHSENESAVSAIADHIGASGLTPRDELFTYAALLMNFNPPEVVISKSDDTIMSQEEIEELDGYIPLAFVDTLLYRGFSARLESDISSMTVWAADILGHALAEKQAEDMKNPALKSFLGSFCAQIAEYHPQEKTFVTHYTDAETARGFIIDLAERVGITVARDVLVNIQNHARTISQSYGKANERGYFYNDRFKNPIAILVTRIAYYLKILDTDEVSFLNPLEQNYFEKRDDELFEKERTEQRMMVTVVDPEKKKVLVVKTSQGYLLPTEGSIPGQRIEGAAARATRLWTGNKGKQQEVRLAGRRPESLKEKYANTNHVGVLIYTDSSAIEAKIPKGKKKIETVGWIDWSDFWHMVSLVPHPVPPDFNRRIFDMRVNQYDQLMREFELKHGVLNGLSDRGHDTWKSSSDPLLSLTEFIKKRRTLEPSFQIIAVPTNYPDDDSDPEFILPVDQQSGILILTFPRLEIEVEEMTAEHIQRFVQENVSLLGCRLSPYEQYHIRPLGTFTDQAGISRAVYAVQPSVSVVEQALDSKKPATAIRYKEYQVLTKIQKSLLADALLKGDQINYSFNDLYTMGVLIDAIWQKME